MNQTGSSHSEPDPIMQQFTPVLAALGLAFLLTSCPEPTPPRAPTGGAEWVNNCDVDLGPSYTPSGKAPKINVRFVEQKGGASFTIMVKGSSDLTLESENAQVPHKIKMTDAKPYELLLEWEGEKVFAKFPGDANRGEYPSYLKYDPKATSLAVGMTSAGTKRIRIEATYFGVKSTFLISEP